MQNGTIVAAEQKTKTKNVRDFGQVAFILILKVNKYKPEREEQEVLSSS